MSKPFTVAGRPGWRAQVCLPNGKRVTKHFAMKADASVWMATTIAAAHAAATAASIPELGGPQNATVAEVLLKYAHQFTLNKLGSRTELLRINHYLTSASIQTVQLGKDANGARCLVPTEPAGTKHGWEEYNQARRDLRKGSYERLAKIACTKAQALTTSDLRDWEATMKAEGLSASTIQKEVALLKAAFNVAIREWRWDNWRNPAVGIKLGQSNVRFVRLSQQEEERIFQALSECDNPQVWPLVEIALLTSMRRKSILELTWDKISFETQEAHITGKGRQFIIPLSPRTIECLKRIPRTSDSRVFKMSANAVKMAWQGVREKAGLPGLRLHDLRHVTATRLAKAGMGVHALQKVLGHTSSRMAEVYVNLMSSDIQQALAVAEANCATTRPLPPVCGKTIEVVMAQNRSERLQKTEEFPTNVIAIGSAAKSKNAEKHPALPAVGKLATG